MDINDLTETRRIHNEYITFNNIKDINDIKDMDIYLLNACSKNKSFVPHTKHGIKKKYKDNDMYKYIRDHYFKNYCQLCKKFSHHQYYCSKLNKIKR